MVDINFLTLSTDSEAIKFLEDHLSEILEDPEIDILSRLKIRLLSLPVLERDTFKKNLLEFLKNNNSSLTSQPIAKTTNLKLPPTVSNWINDYLTFCASQPNQAKKEEYFQKGLAFQGLSLEDRQTLKKLLALFDFLSSSSVRPDGIEEEIVVKDKEGKLKILKGGQFIDLTRPRVFTPSPSPKTVTKPAIDEVKAKAVPSLPKVEDKSGELAPKTGFYLQPEDEEEFKLHKDKINQFELPKAINVDKVVDEIIQENKLTFTDEILKKRFESIAKARLKEIRGEIDTRDLLSRPEKIGGMGYQELVADQIINSISQRIPKMHELVSEEEIEKEAKKLAPEIPSQEIPKPPVVPQAPIAKVGIRQPEVIEPEEPAEKIEAPRHEPPQPRVIPQVIRTQIEPQRPRVEDIKRPTRLVGPVEELRSMNLPDFRRLGTAYIGSIRKLYEKINLLGEESFAKKAEGVRAWRQSQVYQLYLEMGQESMQQGKTIREVVASRQNQSLPYLTEQEFNGLADLNKKLRF